MNYQDRYTQFDNQRTLIAGPTYDELIRTRTRHPNAIRFTVTVQQLGYVGEPITTISQSKWQAITLPNCSMAFVEVQG